MDSTVGAMRSELAVLQELVDIVPGAPLKRTDRKRFMHALGLEGSVFTGPIRASTPPGCRAASRAATPAGGSRSCVGAGSPGALEPLAETGEDTHVGAKAHTHKMAILRCIGDAAYEMPLPPRWTEQVDVRGFVYFSNAMRTEATWEHPLLDAFRDTIEVAGRLVEVAKPMHPRQSLAETAAAVEKHLQEVQSRAAQSLKDWSGPHPAPSGSNSDEFYHNDVTGESSWESPLEVWQYELHARYWLLVQFLQHLHGGKDDHDGRVSRASSTAGPVATPRFHGEISADSVSAIESSFSHSIMSAAVRSIATEIASSLASSAPSFSAPSKWTRATSGEFPDSLHVPKPPPRPPPKPPPPLRHLAAPPRVNDMLPELVLHTASSSSPVGVKVLAPTEAPIGKKPPPPPPKPAPGQLVRRGGGSLTPGFTPLPPSAPRPGDSATEPQKVAVNSTRPSGCPPAAKNAAAVPKTLPSAGRAAGAGAFDVQWQPPPGLPPGDQAADNAVPDKAAPQKQPHSAHIALQQPHIPYWKRQQDAGSVTDASTEVPSPPNSAKAPQVEQLPAAAAAPPPERAASSVCASKPFDDRGSGNEPAGGHGSPTLAAPGASCMAKVQREARAVVNTDKIPEWGKHPEWEGKKRQVRSSGSSSACTIA